MSSPPTGLICLYLLIYCNCVVRCLTSTLPVDFAVSDDIFTSQPKPEPYYFSAGSSGPIIPCVVQAKYTEEPYLVTWIKIVNGEPTMITVGSKNTLADYYDLDTQSCKGCYNLRIKKVDFSRDNGRFYCQVSGSNKPYGQSINAEVVVLVRPDHPEVEMVSTTLREGHMASVKCQSVGGNPPPRITWFFSNGTDVSHLGTVHNSTRLNTPTVGTLSWLASANDNELQLVCKVWNMAMGASAPPYEAVSGKLMVLFPPKVIVGPVSPYNIEVGMTAKLTCSAEGNPPAIRYSWQQSSPDRSSPHSWSEQNISFDVNPDRAGNYTCVAENDEGVGRASLALNVLYGPKIVIQKEFVVKEGDNMRLKCQVDANPPATSVSWVAPDGKRTISDVLDVPSVKKSQAGNYTCFAKNTVTSHGSNAVARSASQSIAVVISYPPGKAVITVQLPVVVGSTAHLNCTAKDVGFPAARYRWRTPGRSRYEEGAYMYTIPEVQLSHAGEYGCMPFNEIGNGEAGFYKLVVSEPAQLEKFLKEEDHVKEDQTGYYLSCSARGSPMPNITWKRDGEDIKDERFLVTHRPELQRCEIPERCSYRVTGILEWSGGLKWSDKGTYTCSAYNGAGVPAESHIRLKMQHKPVIVNDPARPLVAADVGQEVKIVCRASASPEPVFRWFRDVQEIFQSGSARLFNQSFDIYENVLRIRRVQEHDMGSYICKAANLFGEDAFVFKLQRKSRPSMATTVSACSKTFSSVELCWTPGFDGGSPQYFSIRILYPSGDEKFVNTNESVYFRNRRHRSGRSIGIERTPVEYYNITGLMPMSSYVFAVKSWNDLGDTDWSDPVQVITTDVPVFSNLPRPTSAIYNTFSKQLEFKPTQDQAMLCALVYTMAPSGNWESWACLPPNGRADNIPMAPAMKIRFCNLQITECSESTDAMIGVSTALGLEIIAAVCSTAVIFLIFFVILCIYCRRVKIKTEKQSLANGTAEKTKYTEEPLSFQTKSSLAKDKPNGAGREDEKAVNPAVDNGGFIGGSYVDGGLPAGHYDSANGTLTVGRVYQDTDPWRDADGYRLQNQPPIGGGGGGYSEAFDSGYSHYGQFASTYDPANLYADIYRHNMVDMNPAGGTPSVVRDGSVHSSFSTPSQQKRVIREIIV